MALQPIKRNLPSKAEIDFARNSMNLDERAAFADMAEASIKGYAPVRTGRGRDSIKVTVDEANPSMVRISMLPYMWMLNNGFSSFVMYSLEGKTIPIRLPGGQVIFRKASHVGEPRRDPKGRFIGRPQGVNQVRWRHPGVKAMRFVERGLKSVTPKFVKSKVATLIKTIVERLS